MATNIEQSICEAIDIIVNKAVAEATYDKTIQCTIDSCLDASIGQYKVRYQDSAFIAYSVDVDTTYSNGTSVYVLVPGNDMNEDKKILGSTKNLGTNYVSALESDEYYEINGNNVIVSSGSYSLCSYAGTQAIVLYSKDYSESQNLLSIDKTAVEEYIKNSGSIICGGYMRTELPAEQQYKGNYGIIFALDFMDNTGNEVVTRYYTVDIDKMTGNPYRLVYSTRQYGVFDIDASNFIEINYISIFCYDFPNSLPEEECVDDIFITNLELYGANLLSEDDLDNYSLTFVTTKGTYFTENSLDSDTLSIKAQLKVKGKVVDTDARDTPFYWGYEHTAINSQSQYYCKYLGQGWKCINDYNIIDSGGEDEEPIIEWIPSTCSIDVKKSDVIAKEMTYRCAVIYDDTVISKNITIKNLGSNYDITIVSDSGTQFYFDIGSPTLTCLVNGVSNQSYSYSWSMVDNNDMYTFLSETPEENAEYNEIITEYNTLVAAIKDGSALPSASQARLEALEEQIANLDKTMRVDKNIIYHLAVNMIVSFSAFKCTVYSDDIYLGTASITLTNSLTAEGSYSLLINNGTYLYKYNESGVSPTSDSEETSIETRALTFTIYDNLGNPIDDDVARHCTIEWMVPTTDTLLQISDGYTPTSTEDGVAVYSNIMSLSYTIASRYDITKTNNDISLYVNYKDMALYARTNLTFTKEGENGTNGTDYTCKLVPNAATGITPKYVILSQTGNSTDYSCNFTPAGGVSSGLYLRVEVYHNETRVYNSTASGTSSEGKQIDIVWSILQNTYSYNYQDTSSLSINSSSGKITYSGYNSRYSDSGVLPPANIVKVAVTSEGITNYATFPIITVRNTTNYECELKEGSGFLYATYTSDGQSPGYDNVNPFEATVTRYVNNYWEDISTNTNSNYILDYKWYCLGGTYEVTSYNSSGKEVWSWVNSSNLEQRYWIGDLERNQYAAKPVNEYTNECVTNALECIVTHNGTEVTRMHIPVHLMLDRYGLAALNGWDGNSVEINEEGGFILAPQVGAGIKEKDNSFTGIVIGATKESGMQNTDVGLIGYAYGQRSIFLDAYTGKAVFGTSSKGQIIIDPGSSTSTGTAQIRSGNYSTGANGEGLLIDLTVPEIRFGSGNFSVDQDGYITAKGGGNIAGFYINDHSLWTNNKDCDNNNTFRISSVDGLFNRAIGGYDREDLVLASNKSFGVSSDGDLYAVTGHLGGWIMTATKLYNDLGKYEKTVVMQSPTTSNTWVFAAGGEKHSSYSDCPFRVDKKGNLFAENADIAGTINATSGHIGLWSINDGIYSGTDSMDSKVNGTFIGVDGIRQYHNDSYLNITDSIVANHSASGRYTELNAGSVELGFDSTLYGSFRISSRTLTEDDGTESTYYGITLHGDEARHCKYISFGHYSYTDESYISDYYIDQTRNGKFSNYRHNFTGAAIIQGNFRVPNNSGENYVALCGDLHNGSSDNHHLYVGRDAYFNSTVDIAGATTLSGGATISNGLTVTGGATIKNGLTATGGVSLGATEITSTLDVTGVTTLSGGASISSGLTVTGGATIKNGLTATGGVSLGATEITSTLDVTGATTLSGGASISSGLTVAGGATIKNGLTATGGVSLGATEITSTLTVSSATTLSGGASISSGLTVTGGATIKNGLTVTGGVSLGATEITSTLDVSSATTLSATTVDGSFKVGTSTSNTHSTHLYGSAAISGRAAIGQTSTNSSYQLYVSGSAYASDGWAGTSDVTLKSNIQPLSARTDTFLDKLEPISFTFKDDDVGKTHFGVTYQNVCEALEAEGIDPDTSGVVGTSLDENGEEKGALYYDELIAPLIYEVKTLKQQVQDLKAEFEKFKANN